MERMIEKIRLWLKWSKYRSLWGLLFGLIMVVITLIYFENIWIAVGSFILISLIAMVIIQLSGIFNYVSIYSEYNKKNKSIAPEELRGKSKKLDILLDLDKELCDFFNKYSSKTYFEKELNKHWEIQGEYFVKKAQKVLSLMNNQELMYGLLGTEFIKDIVNYFEYFKPCVIDSEYLKTHPENAKKYYYENLMRIDSIKENAINEYYFKIILNLICCEEIEKVILSYMGNDDLLDLANSSDIWYDKLYYYGFLKVKSEGDKYAKEST